MTIEKQTEETGIVYIKVILPLKIEWEPYYYYTLYNNSAGGSNHPCKFSSISTGIRVKVIFAGKEYTGIVSETGVTPEVDKNKIKQIISIEDRLEKISGKEIALWRQVAEYYLCTVGEVYKAAYPAFRTNSEKSRASQEERKEIQLKKELESITKKITTYKERLKRRQDSLIIARKESVIKRLKEEISRIEYEVNSLTNKYSAINSTISGNSRNITGTPEKINTEITLSKAQDRKSVV